MPNPKPTTSVWTRGAQLSTRPKLSSDASAEVCVIGGGMAGLSVAYELACRGRNVLLIEKDGYDAGETSRTTAQLVTALDRGWHAIVEVHGRDVARLAAESHARAIDRIEGIAKLEEIDCGFQRLDGYLVPGESAAAETIDAEREAAQAAGLSGVEKVEAAPRFALGGPCLRYPRQGQLHPLRYLDGLTRAILKRGGRVFGQSRAVRLDHDAPISIELEGGVTIFAENVVIATNTPFSYVVAPHIRQAAYRSYVIACEAEPRGKETPAALWWDTESPFHYVRTLAAEAGERERILVGGEDHKTGQAEIAPEEIYGRLEAWSRRNLAGLGPVVERWSGQIMESMDGLGLIGRMESGRKVFVATGDSGNGMTHGAIAGMLISDLICDRVNSWSDVYDPTRLRVSAMGRFAQENLNVARHYADWVTYASGKDADDIPRHSGAVIRRGLSPVAVYRDDAGELHERSAVCPHLGCIVAWNAVEATWDCPCHGSRFRTDGAVLNGPANRGLAPAPGSDAHEDVGEERHHERPGSRANDNGRATMRTP